jgi:hypothetical protein
MPRLGDVEQQGLGDGRDWLDSRMVVVSSSARGCIGGWPGKVNVLILPKDGLAEDGEGLLSSVCSGVRSGFAGPVWVPDSL